ncbi:autophagy protein atg9 [Microbotryomycetes sp. JL221]|nr:autophagy protein atg9 [Microbotryomycetes sp. JL221]
MSRGLRRVEDALGSIFLARDSVYHDLDSVPSPPRSPYQPTTRSTRDDNASKRRSDTRSRSNSHSGGVRHDKESDDPFNTTASSVGSPKPATTTRELSHQRHDQASLSTRVDTHNSPFQSDVIDRQIEEQHHDETRATAQVRDEGDGESMTTYHDPISSSGFIIGQQPQSNPPAGTLGYRVGSSDDEGNSFVGVGQTSLMALLGGSDSLAMQQRQSHNVASASRSNLKPNRPRASLSQNAPRISGMSMRESRALMDALPLPPSAMSDGQPQSEALFDENDERSGGARQDYDEDEDDDDQPPDFTSRVPLTGGISQHKRRARVADTSSFTSPDRQPPWSGLKIGSNGRNRSEGPSGGILGSISMKDGRRTAGMSARDRALWRWINVEDLDSFLQQVYVYYVGKGIWAIALSRLLNLLTVGWVITFSTFLVGCIDYNVLWKSHSLEEVVVPRCISRFSGLTLFLVTSVGAFYLWRVVRFGLGVRKLWEMHEFYAELLEVPENDIQTIPWHFIVTRLSTLRASHPAALSMRGGGSTTAQRLDAHDIANRIMREENYLIALFNKDLLDLSMPVPHALQRVAPRFTQWAKKSMLTKTLEWNLSFCLVGFLFGKDGQVRRAFLTDRNKAELTAALRHRFMLMALINAVFAPFIVLYLLMWSFFRYFEEYHKNPSTIGSRQFTPLARWKFREFNELPHLFQQRLNRAHPIADQYVNQFPKEKTALVSRFIAFLAGSFAAVLILFSLIDPDAFLHFEVTPGRTVLFYIGIFGTILAVARGMVPDENKVVDTEELMRHIVEQTHYLPAEWRGKLHSAEVHTMFGQLFQMKVALFVQEVLSVIMTPFVLWYTLPECSGSIVDFFREFSVHVDGLGYVCSFAVFDFKRHGDTRFGAPVQSDTDRWKSGEGKMEKSFLTFAQHHPSWVPRDQTQSLFLSKMSESVAMMPSNGGGPSSAHGHQQSQVGMSIGAGGHSFMPGSSIRQSQFHHPSSLGLHPRFAPSSVASVHGATHLHSRASTASRMGATTGVVEEADEFEHDADDSHQALSSPNIGVTRPSVSMPSSKVFHRSGKVSTLASPPSTQSHGLHSPFNSRQASSASRIIHELSRLDDEPFVAPTDDAPFGFVGDEDENDRHQHTVDDEDEDDDEVTRKALSAQVSAADEADPFARRGGLGTKPSSAGIGGMLGELYDMHGKRW